ncbi:claudin-34-like [Pseudonaja textilis]|uniref:claudin-34-like n=1 Tax=Pseudonaja textilis TaxID=8673 RepID=UPI000EAAB605|nr:claudin-34-like [Pseudonaja textilis]
MIDNLSFLQIRGVADPLPTKSSALIYKSNKSLNQQLPSEKESIITKWLSWINKAQLGGYFLGILGSIMCITSTANERWRIWHVESEDGLYPGVVWVGIWRACYLHSTHPENRYIHCEEFTENMLLLPKEIFLAQDLMTLSCIVGAVAITIMSFALGIIVKDIGQKKNLFTLFSVGGLLNFLAGILVLIPIFWNLHSILENRNVKFPESFKMPTIPKYQEVGAAIYVGYSAIILFLASGALIICNRSVLQVHATNDVSPSADIPLTPQFSSNFGSSVIINVTNRDEPLSSEDELSSLYYVDINKDTSHSIQPQLLDNTKNIPVISVTSCQ